MRAIIIQNHIIKNLISKFNLDQHLIETRIDNTIEF